MLRRSITIKKTFGISLTPGKTIATVLQIGIMRTNDPKLLALAGDPKFDLVEFTDKTEVSTKTKPKSKTTGKGGSNAK